MTGEMLVVTGIITVAAAYVARATWRAWQPSGGCASGCGKCAPAEPTLVRIEHLQIRRSRNP
jgi:hypothetical protein